jgi:hypothetical protein
MKSTEFAYWLQGFFELSESNTLSEKQVETIKNHLNLVFYHEIDPSYSSNPKVQAEMQSIHNGKPSLEELGQEHGFNVNPGFPGSGFPFKDEGGGLLRC